jgi:hypothetical protein
MKLRYAAIALALLGGYLMLPAQTRARWVGPQRYDDIATLSSWTIARSFDHAELCQATQQQAGNAAIGTDDPVCVTVDDPHLKPY